MNPVSIVVLGKYQDIFENFRASVELYAPDFQKILVRDGTDIPSPEGWITIQGPEVFKMAANENIGWQAVPSHHDIAYFGDDAELLEPQTIERLSEIAYSDPTIGILSPRIIGSCGNELQMNPRSNLQISEQRLAFCAIFIKREVLNTVGFLDERFADYGFDDDHYCLKVQKAGYKLAVTKEVCVRHEGGSKTFIRNGTDRGEAMERTKLIFDEAVKEL